ncbi:MAG: hypothetical protein QOJ29_3673 [Thermoleophilaceae bacterium]|jgi:hypothetical protein|nr:hypothetical protein [Thermoleophilaceae bacterium]
MATADERFDAWDNDSITAQDVVDALRLALMGQKDAAQQAKLLEALLEFAPETDGDRGTALLLRLIHEGTLAVALR